MTIREETVRRRSLVLFAVAGLLVLALAGPRADPAIPAKRLARQHQDLDSVQTLPIKTKVAVPPPLIDANRVIRHVRRRQESEPSPAHDSSPFTDSAFMPAPGIPGDSVNTQFSPAVAFGATGYLVVWHDNRDSCTDICGARVSLSGSVLDSAGFVISTNTSSSGQYNPSVAFDGTNYLVAWEDNRDETSSDIYAARISQSGSVLDADGLLVGSTSADEGDQFYPSVAFDGTNYLVVWWGESWPNDDLFIRAARVSQSGSVLDPDGIQLSNQEMTAPHPSVAFGDSEYLVVWHGGIENHYNIYGARVSKAGEERSLFKIAGEWDQWQQLPAVAFDGANYLVAWTELQNIYGTRVSQSDSVLDPNHIGISTGPWNEGSPRVAFGGSEYLVFWEDFRNADADIYGCQVNRAGEVGEAYAISTDTNDQNSPVAACGLTEATAMAAYQSVTGVVDGIDYGNSTRLWARLGSLPPIGDVGTASISFPVASLLSTGQPIQPEAVIRNYGGVDLRQLNVRFTVSPGSYSSTESVPSLAAGETCTVVFDSLDLTTGLFTARCSTMLDDAFRGNNTQTVLFQGCTFIDCFDKTDGSLVPNPDTCWTRGVPQSPWALPPNDSTVWGDRLSGFYGSSENSTLTSPIYQALQDNPAIAFQHNLSTESGCDGGNFSFSTDSGSTWTVLTPCAGRNYRGYVEALGESGWSGWDHYPSGWSQSLFTIPVAEDAEFHVRWRFATDDEWPGDSSYGWLLDEVAGIGCDTVYHPGMPEQPGGRIVAELGFRPNPMRRIGQVHYTLPRDCDMSIKLYDATGTLAACLANGPVKAGKHAAAMDVSKLQHGVYFLMLAGAGDVETAKVIIE